MQDSQPEGFLTLPLGGKGPGALVLHPWWGLNDTIRGVCTRLADAGYVAYAPDLYHGKLATTIAEAESLSNALDAEQAKADIAAAVEHLSRRADAGGLAVIGFSLGAFFALDVSTTKPDRIGAVVLFYGTGPGDFSASQAAYLGHFAAEDPYEPAIYVDGLEAELRAVGRPVTFHRYPGVGHWFFEPDRTEAYDRAAATLAWERTLAFLQDSLPLAP
jgi:carboxymethylenebutenolidase